MRIHAKWFARAARSFLSPSDAASTSDKRPRVQQEKRNLKPRDAGETWRDVGLLCSPPFFGLSAHSWDQTRRPPRPPDPTALRIRNLQFNWLRSRNARLA